MDELRDLVHWCKTVGWADMRKWSEFGGQFKPPEWTRTFLEKRVWTNIVYYRTNYIAIGSVLLLWAIISSFKLLFALLVIGAAWFYVFQLRRFPIVINQRVLTRQEKVMGLCVGSLMVLFLFGCVYDTIWVLGGTSVVTLVHATMRPTSIKSSATRVRTDMKMRAAGPPKDEDDVEDGAGDDSEEEATMVGGGPMPGRVESRARRNEKYAQRRAQLREKYPALSSRSGGAAAPDDAPRPPGTKSL